MLVACLDAVVLVLLLQRNTDYALEPGKAHSKTMGTWMPL